MGKNPNEPELVRVFIKDSPSQIVGLFRGTGAGCPPFAFHKVVSAPHSNTTAVSQLGVTILHLGAPPFKYRTTWHPKFNCKAWGTCPKTPSGHILQSPHVQSYAQSPLTLAIFALTLEQWKFI